MPRNLNFARPGELPPQASDGKFSFRKHLQGKFMCDVPLVSATSKDYRAKKALQLLGKIKRGEITGPAAEGIERDYRKEFKRLRAKRPLPRPRDG